MKTRKLMVAAALTVAVILTAAPADANGISVHQAAQQYLKDLKGYEGPFKHFEEQVSAWGKSHGNQQSTKVNAMFAAIVGPTARFGHELRTQKWPSSAIGDVEALEADTTTMREDFANTANVNGFTPSSMSNDMSNWANDAATVASDLHVNMPN